MKKIIFITLSLLCMQMVRAQKKVTTQTFDTTRKTVVVTSAYKPSLKPAAKINFSAPSPFIDTVKPVLSYNVPAQNLFFTYQPGALKPLALTVDGGLSWVNDNYIKAGVGNYSTFMGEAGASFGNGVNSLVNITGKHFSQKGSLPFQQYGQSAIGVSGVYSPDENLEWRGKLGYETSRQYYYGFQPDTIPFVKDSLKQMYNTLSALIGLRNKQPNSNGLSYDPSIAINLFSDNRKGKETNLLLNAPFKKVFDENLSLNLGITADITSLRTLSDTKIANNLFYLSPTVSVKRSLFTLNAGVIPAWDNNKFYLLPNISAVIKVKDKPFVLQAGWTGFFQKNNYQSLSAFNPFIAQPSNLFNTRTTEFFGGLKGSAGSHLSYNARVGIRTNSNAALFLSDTLDGKSFNVINQPSMNALVVHGEVGYSVQEKFSLLAGATINQFSNLPLNTKAWGLLPLELTGALRWQVMQDIQFKADAFIWNGSSYFHKGEFPGRSKGAFDLNLGAELTIVPKLNLWIQANNLLNNKYQRWDQYQVVGLNLMGGVVYSFSKQTK